MLAINTAFKMANLALKTHDSRIVYKTLDSDSKHSENVLKTVDEMCQQLNVDILDIGTLAVVTGPGSFTGLRIGTAIAKALGCVNNKLNFLKLSSLELMAYIIAKNKMLNEDFICVLNALSGLYFVADFDANGIKIKEERMIDLQQFERNYKPLVVLEGDLEFDNAISVQLNSQDLLEFAEKKAEQGEFVTLEEVAPLYLRLSQAEDNLISKKS